MNKTLRLIRIYHAMTQKEMAEKLGISRSHLSEIEAGRKGISLDLLLKYAVIIDVPLSSIIYFDEWRSNPNTLQLHPKIKSMMEFTQFNH